MKKWKTALLGSALIFILAGCNMEPLEADVEDTIENGGAYKKEVEAKPAVDVKENPKADNVNTDENKQENTAQQEDTKILSTYKIESETLNFESDLQNIIDKVHETGGYVSSNEITNSKAERETMKESKLTIKVPKEETNEVIKIIDEKLAITSELLTSVDITDKYYDNESRLKNIESREERLKELYSKTNDIAEIMKIDEKLNEITEEKDELARNKVKMEDRFSFSRIDLKIKEVKKISIVEKENLSSSEKINKAFKSTGKTIKSAAVGIFVFLIGAFPLIIIGLGGFIAYKKILKKIKENEEKKKQENRENQEIQENEENKEEEKE